MQPKVCVYSTSMYSPLEISYALSRLNVSHVLECRGVRKKITRPKPQPKAVYVTDSLTNYRPEAVNFIVSCIAELGLTNYTPLSSGTLEDVLKDALIKQVEIVPSVTVMSDMDYVNAVAKPSILNKIQTEVYRLNPYALRKQTHAIVLDYLNSKISKRKLKEVLSRNLKQEALLPLLLSADSLRNAVARLSKETPEEIEADTGHPTFELLYLSKERT